MYNNPSGTLPLTGISGLALPFLGLSVPWSLVVSFVLIMAGVAILAIVPKQRKETAKVLPQELRHTTRLSARR